MNIDSEFTSRIGKIIKIDDEFKALIPPLSDDEYALLEASILADGCRDALIMWGNILVDGHNRYAICQKHGLPFKVETIHLDCREAVIVWMIENQLGRRNIADAVRIELAVRLEPAEAALGKERQRLAGEQFGMNHPKEEVGAISPQPPENGKTRPKLAKKARVGEKKFDQGKYILAHAPAMILKMWRGELISTNRAYKVTKALQKLPPEVHECTVKLCEDNEEKIGILSRLHDSMGQPDTNGTYQEVLDTGGFQYGKEMEKWLNYSTATIEDIRKGLDSIKQWHIEQTKEQKHAEKVEATRRAIAELKDPSNFGVITGDMRRLFDDLEDNSIDLFFTDPPYPFDYIHLYEELGRLAAAKLKPGGLCLAYSGQTFLPQVMERLGNHLTYWWMFAISHTGGNLAIWQRQLQNEWKPVLVFAKPLANGKLPFAPEYTVDFVPGGGRDKRYHEWGQDAGEITYWIEKLSAPGALVCDPFVGGGSVPVACKLVGRRWIGTEIDEAMASEARLRIANVKLEGISDQAA